MQELVQQVFDYSLIDERDRDFLIGKEQSIKQRTAQTVIENGRDLLEAKARVGHGNFLKWVEGCFPWSRTTAFNMMSVAENIKCLTGEHLENFQTKALYLLASPSVPETARQEAISIAESGEKVTNEKAKELIEAHKRIDDLEKQLADARNQIPTEDVQAKIFLLENQLKAEREKPAQIEQIIIEKKPDDYDDLISDRNRLTDEKGRLLNQIKKIKDEQAAEVTNQVNQKLKALNDDFNLKNKQLDAVQGRIDALRPTLESMEKIAGALNACKTASKDIRHNLTNISITISDLFSDYEIPESEISGLLFLADEMMQGAVAFKRCLNDKNQIQIGE